MNQKFGEQNYDLGRFMNRGVHELSNAIVFPDSNVPLRDHSGLYGSKENQEPAIAKEAEPQTPPEKEQEAPDLER